MFRTVIRPVALALSTALAVAACSSQIDDSKLEDSIREQAEEAFEGFEIGEVDCPENIQLEEGDIFDCELQIEDASVDIEVTQENDEGNVSIEQTAAVLSVERLVDTIEQGIAEQTGVEATVDCGNDTVRVERAGEVFECSAEAADGSDSAVVTVTVVDVDGNVEWELG